MKKFKKVTKLKQGNRGDIYEQIKESQLPARSLGFEKFPRDNVKIHVLSKFGIGLTKTKTCS